jgi:hypothetical protein
MSASTVSACAMSATEGSQLRRTTQAYAPHGALLRLDNRLTRVARFPRSRVTHVKTAPYAAVVCHLEHAQGRDAVPPQLVFATNDVEVDTTSAIDGPIMGSNVKLGQSVTTLFPTISTVPAGMPSNPTVCAQPLPPANYSG